MPLQRAVRGRLLDFPGEAGTERRYLDDGLVLVDAHGRIAAVGPAADLAGRLPSGVPLDHYPDALIVPGFIDAHIHLPQTRVVASYGTQLLEWLTRYTFVEEERFADPAVQAQGAAFFLDELARNGTTTAAVYGSVHAGSIAALFEAAAARGMAMIGGKVMMDREAPAALLDTARQGYDDSRALIERWHNRERQRYAVTPRFAITSTEAQLEAAGALLREFPDVYLQTHLAENDQEIERVARLFPDARHYTDVYDRFGLLGPRSLFGHCLHLDDDEMARLSATRSVAVLCPTSNLFMGSGLFDLTRLTQADRPVRLALATDIGGGTSYSMLQTAAAAYQVAQLRGVSLSPSTLLRQMTRGNAEALGLDDEIGSLEAGHFADLAVLDTRATPALRQRLDRVSDLDVELFAVLILGDDRAIAATYAAGRPIHLRA